MKPNDQVKERSHVCYCCGGDMFDTYHVTTHKSMHAQLQLQHTRPYKKFTKYKKQQYKHTRLHNDNNGSRAWMFAIVLLLLLPLNAGHSYAGVDSLRLDNCNDVNGSTFNSVRWNGSAPTRTLTGQNITWATQTLTEDAAMVGQQRLLKLFLNKTIEMPNTMQIATTTTTTASTLPNMGSTSNDWKCCCWNNTVENEVQCSCVGEGLNRVPQVLTLPVQRLTITKAGLPRVRSTGLTVYAATLMDVVLKDLKELETIEDGAFSSLRLLRTIYISHAPKLLFLSKDVFQGISDTIKTIRIINSGLLSVPDLIHLPPKNILQMLDLDNNHITRIEKKSITIKTEQLILANNEISYIDDSAFYGSEIAKLLLMGNRGLRDVHPNAFNGTIIQELDLSSTSLVRLPSVGLQEIEVLRIENTYTLKTIPSIYNFKYLQKAFLTHSFHCCAFKFPSRHDPQRHAQRMQEIEKWQKRCLKTSPTPAVFNNGMVAEADNRDNRMKRAVSIEIKKTERAENMAETNWHQGKENGFNNIATNHQNGGVFSSQLMATVESNETELQQQQQVIDMNVDRIFGYDNYDYNDMDNLLMSDVNDEFGVFHENITINTGEMQLDEYCGNFTFRNREVVCYPMPDALNPCEDVMGYQWLRISVWIVVTLAVVGNIAVLVVILSIRTDTSVPRFLMCHLAFADLCLGLYLLLIASIDAHSMGEFFNYAYDWQYGAGCKVAGFLTVFASHLSVFTLTVITIERWLAITQALYLNKRLKLKTATYIMFGGWMYAIFMSSLPLFGISNYSSTSICLPMEIGDFYDIVYLVLILALNGTAFCIIAICYAQIYLSLGQETRHAHHAHTGDMSIAKKMALLVFTNFACCAPIAFFGLTALAGYPLINVTKSKILLVFFYPLNSCADPYLYAILTAQYRQDLYTLLSNVFVTRFGICKQKALKYKESISLPANTNCTTLPVSRHSIARKSLQSNKLPETQLMLQNNENFV